MALVKSFHTSQFTNPSGEVVFRVSGWLDGKRIRKNFSTRAEAEAERRVLEIQRLQIDSGIRTAITRLSDAQLNEAEAVFQRLGGKPQTLSFYVDLGLSHYREPAREKRLSEAIDEYVATKEHERAQDLLSTSQCARIKRDLKRMERHLRVLTVAELTGPKLADYFEMGRPSSKTYNNRRGIVSTFIKYAFLKSWINENPLARLPAQRIRRRRSMAKTLTAKQAEDIMDRLENYQGARWVPFFALCLFAGIRPAVPEGEICRLRPSDIDLKTEIISISAEVSKVREPRKVVIQPNLAAWLRAYPLTEFPIVVPNFQRQRAELAKALGLTHDVLRHTYISMFVAKYRSIGEAALQAGNSEAIIRKHYLDLKTAAEAADFFSIVPRKKERLQFEQLASLPDGQIGRETVRQLTTS